MPTTIGVDLEAKSSTTLAYTQEGTIVVSETEIEIEGNLSCTSLEARREDTAGQGYIASTGRGIPAVHIE
jgi:hypothetical protein